MPAERWAGIGLSAMIPTLVLADADGASHRAGDHVGGRSRRSGRRTVPRRGRRRRRCTDDRSVGRRPLPAPDGAVDRTRGARRASSGPRGSSARRTICSPGLTGEAVTDPSTATGFGCYSLADGPWDGATRRRGCRRSCRRCRPSSSRGASRRRCGDRARAAGGDAGRPRRGGLGVRRARAGATAPGERVSLWGTSTVILGVSDAARARPRAPVPGDAAGARCPGGGWRWTW